MLRLLLLLLCLPGAAGACTLAWAPGAAVPAGRVAGLLLQLRGGTVAAVPSLPFGWRIAVEAEPSWTTRASGQAIVGAAFLEPAAALGLFTLAPEPGGTCAALLRPGLLRLRMFEGGRERTVAVAPGLLRVAE